jgi:hypothetical protein
MIGTRARAVLDELDKHVDGVVDKIKLKAHRDPWALCFNLGAGIGILAGLLLASVF